MLLKLLSCFFLTAMPCFASGQQHSSTRKTGTVLTNATFLKYRFYQDSILSAERIVYDTVRTADIQNKYFAVTATSYNLPHSWLIPFPKQNMKGQDSLNDRLNTGELFFYSVKENYSIHDTDFTVYKFDTYNCYDPLCGQRHGHRRFKTGFIFFSPQYGFLLEKEGDFYSFLISTKEEKIPAALLNAILKKNPVPEKVANSYRKDLKQ